MYFFLKKTIRHNDSSLLIKKSDLQIQESDKNIIQINLDLRNCDLRKKCDLIKTKPNFWT